ncbi:OmpA family protein [bacterium]|nr:OmpA family protein [bacterium]MBU1918848.1 OmpA family protein [bacterium]
MKHLLTITIFALFILINSSAYADGPSIQLFHPTVDGKGAFTVYDTSILRKKDWRMGFILNYGHAPLQVNNQNASEGLLSFDALFALGLNEWLELGLDIALALNQEVGANFTNQLTESGLHDFGLIAKIKLLKQDQYGFGLAFIPRVFIPTGEAASYFGDDGGSYGGWFAIDRKWEKLKLMFNMGAMFRLYNNQFNNISVRHEFDFGLGACYELAERFVYAKAEFSGATQFNDFFSNSLTTPLQFYTGIDVKLRQGIVLKMGGSAGITDAYGTPDWRAVFGATYIPQAHDFMFGRKKFRKHMSHDVAVHFPFNDAILQIDSYRKLERFIRLSKEYLKKSTITLAGHADGLGDKTANEDLALKRANAVKQYLISQGIDPNRIQLHEPTIHNPTDGPHDHINMSHRKVVLQIKK